MNGTLEDVGANGYEAASAESRSDYAEAFDAGVERLESLVAEAARRESSWHGRLRAGLAALLAELEREPAIGRALFVEVHAAGAEALERRGSAIRKAVDFVDRARVESDGASACPLLAPEGIVAGIHAVIHARLSAGAEEGFRGLLPEFMYFAVLPYFGADAAHAEMISTGV